ncbi:hypothetical protein MKW92_000654 [Papaver armeniacum]|nr:hypothetical protein MKW92_000654 [Papaver armeniacum]
MTSSVLSFALSIFPNLIVILLFTTANPVLGHYKSIFSFGDSLADTGNVLYSQTDEYVGKLPYGRTYFHRANGRFSDGRVVLDFIAQSVGLPLLPAYLGSTGKDLHQGVNFAVGGGTALDASFFEERKITVPSNASLGVQLEWFKQLLPSLCNPSTGDCHEFLKTSLVLMGEIGGNDYNHPFFQGRGLEEIKSFGPEIVNAISSAIKVLIKEGAVTFMVPGNLPIGCSSAYLTQYKTPNKEDYDENGWFKNGALKACCGGEGPYDCNKDVPCGSVNARVCDDPSTYVNWDGVHLTEAAYRFLANVLIEENHQFFFPAAKIIGATTTHHTEEL